MPSKAVGPLFPVTKKGQHEAPEAQPSNPVEAFGNQSSQSESDMTINLNRFLLHFDQVQVERLFKAHYNYYVVGKVHIGFFILVFVHVFIGAIELVIRPDDDPMPILIVHSGAIALAFIFYVASLQQHVLRHYFERTLELSNVLQGFLLVEWQMYNGGRWSLAPSYIFILLIFGLSGLRFPSASCVSMCHLVMLYGAFHFDLLRHHHEWNTSDFPRAFRNLVIVTCFCMAQYYLREHHVRMGYITRVDTAKERKRRDFLLESMLPTTVLNRLKIPNCNKSDINRKYERVTILFCYISDFKALTLAVDDTKTLVKLIHEIFTEFDHATERLGVYKMEAIAETYMCASGVPQVEEQHCSKIAGMAMKMMDIVRSNHWCVNDREIQIQIGIHTGAVVAGVVGNKSYSYHLFGDSVNTASRMCSTSKPGHIHCSTSSYDALFKEETLAPKVPRHYHLESRGTIYVKGKGNMETYFLSEKDTGGVSSSTTDDPMLFQPSMLQYQKSQKSLIRVDTDHLDIDARTLRFKSQKSLSFSQTSAEARRVEKLGKELNATFASEYDLMNQKAVRLSLVLIQIYFVWTLLTLDENEVTLKIFMTIFIVTMTGFIVMLKANVLQHFAVTIAVIGFMLVNVTKTQVVRRIESSSPAVEESEVPLDFHVTECVCSIFYISHMMNLRFKASVGTVTVCLLMYLITLVLQHISLWNICAYLCFTGITAVMESMINYKRELGLRLDYLAHEGLNKETQKCIVLLGNMFPSARHAEALMQRRTICDELTNVTLLYSDLVGFTTLASTMSSDALCQLLDTIYSQFDQHLEQYGMYKMDTIGDAFIVVGGLPGFDSDGAHHAMATIAFGLEMLKIIRNINLVQNLDIQIRIGVHTGAVIGGVVGIKRPRYLFWGPDTIVANTLESTGLPDKIQISTSTFESLPTSCHPVFRVREIEESGDTKATTKTPHDNVTYFFQDSVDNCTFLKEFASARCLSQRQATRESLKKAESQASQSPVMRTISEIKKRFRTSVAPNTSSSELAFGRDDGESPSMASQEDLTRTAVLRRLAPERVIQPTSSVSGSRSSLPHPPSSSSPGMI